MSANLRKNVSSAPDTSYSPVVGLPLFRNNKRKGARRSLSSYNISQALSLIIMLGLWLGESLGSTRRCKHMDSSFSSQLQKTWEVRWMNIQEARKDCKDGISRCQFLVLIGNWRTFWAVWGVAKKKKPNLGERSSGRVGRFWTAFALIAFATAHGKIWLFRRKLLLHLHQWIQHQQHEWKPLFLLIRSVIGHCARVAWVIFQCIIGDWTWLLVKLWEQPTWGLQMNGAQPPKHVYPQRSSEVTRPEDGGKIMESTYLDVWEKEVCI